VRVARIFPAGAIVEFMRLGESGWLPLQEVDDRPEGTGEPAVRVGERLRVQVVARSAKHERWVVSRRAAIAYDRATAAGLLKAGRPVDLEVVSADEHGVKGQAEGEAVYIPHFRARRYREALADHWDAYRVFEALGRFDAGTRLQAVTAGEWDDRGRGTSLRLHKAEISRTARAAVEARCGRRTLDGVVVFHRQRDLAAKSQGGRHRIYVELEPNLLCRADPNLFLDPTATFPMGQEVSVAVAQYVGDIAMFHGKVLPPSSVWGVLPTPGTRLEGRVLERNPNAIRMLIGDGVIGVAKISRRLPAELRAGGIVECLVLNAHVIPATPTSAAQVSVALPAYDSWRGRVSRRMRSLIGSK
jgi:hypothetical protein